MSCSGIPWICSWTSEFCGSWPRLCQGVGWYCEAFKIAPPQNSWLCPMQQSWAEAGRAGGEAGWEIFPALCVHICCAVKW